MIERVHALPGVRAAGISEEVLLGDPGVQELTAEGGTATPEATLRLPLRIDAVSEGYLAAVGVPLLASGAHSSTGAPEAQVRVRS